VLSFPRGRALTPVLMLCLPLPARLRPQWWELPQWWAVAAHVVFAAEVCVLLALGLDPVEAFAVPLLLTAVLGQVVKAVAGVRAPWLLGPAYSGPSAAPDPSTA
jgi:hypothetical protein